MTTKRESHQETAEPPQTLPTASSDGVAASRRSERGAVDGKTLEQIRQEQGIVVTDKHRDVARRIKRVANEVAAQIEAEFGRPIRTTFTALEEMLAKFLPDNSEELERLRASVEASLEELSAAANSIEDDYNSDDFDGDLDAAELEAETIWRCVRKVREALNPTQGTTP